MDNRKYALRFGEEGNYKHSARANIGKAARLGWGDGTGESILACLQVGETVTDIDGDTWERVE